MPQKMTVIGAEVKKFAAAAKRNYAPAKVILFGSRARGDWLEESDYDFIIVSEKFGEIDFLDRMKKVYLECEVKLPAEILCYTPQEFEHKRKQIGIVAQAVKEGIDL